VPQPGDVGEFLLAHGTVNIGHPERAKLLLKIVALFAVVWTMPNTQQILAHYSTFLGVVEKGSSRLLWQPSLYWAVAVVFFCDQRFRAPDTARFLYFQF